MAQDQVVALTTEATIAGVEGGQALEEGEQERLLGMGHVVGIVDHLQEKSGSWPAPLRSAFSRPGAERFRLMLLDAEANGFLHRGHQSAAKRRRNPSRKQRSVIDSAR